jgi:hypothetical protein
MLAAMLCIAVNTSDAAKGVLFWCCLHGDTKRVDSTGGSTEYYIRKFRYEGVLFSCCLYGGTKRVQPTGGSTEY